MSQRKLGVHLNSRRDRRAEGDGGRGAPEGHSKWRSGREGPLALGPEQAMARSLDPSDRRGSPR